MEAVVTEGTAKAVFAGSPFSVAGKTGTAHVAGGNVKYHHGVYQASFVGYFPAEAPEYTCIVLIRTKPFAPLHYGGQLAAPVFKEVANKVYAMYVQKKTPAHATLPADSTLHAYAGDTKDVQHVLQTLNVDYTDSSDQKGWSEVTTVNGQPVMKSTSIGKQCMPDVRRLPLRDALYLLENLNVKVTVRGRGKVMAQDIAPGTPLTKNQTITLLLN